MGKIGIIARREFNERVKKKSFIITTILMPVFFVAMIALMVYMTVSPPEKTRRVIVIDDSGVIAPNLTDEDKLKFQLADRPFEEVRNEGHADVFGILVIGSDVVANPRNIQLYTYEASTVGVESTLASKIQKIIEQEKLKAYDIENLAQIMEQVKTRVSIQTREFTDSGESKESSSTVSMIAAYLFAFLIYMFIFLYGNMVMQGVIEEKSSKVIELMVSSVRPFQLMMGKILGIAAVAVTQLLIWVVFIGIAAPVVMNLMAGDLMEAVAATQAGVPMADMGFDTQDMALYSRLTDFGYLGYMFLGFVLYFIGGYLLYAAMFAAVGSAVDNEKDTQNLQMPITIPLLLAIFVMISVMKEPHSQLAFWFSMIPFTSPVVMMARLPYSVPTWELVLSLVLLYATFVAVVWLAGKIYRVGIFMYGKKPTLAELWKWSRYKY